MILGQAEEEGTNWYNVAAGAIESAVGGLATGLSRLVGGKDVEAAVTDTTPVPPEATAEVTEDPISVGKAAARKPSAAYGDAGTDSGVGYSTGSSIWPWVIGLGVVAGGAYWFVKRRKRGKKGKRR